MIEVSEMSEFVAEGVDEARIFEGLTRRHMPESNLDRAV